MTKKAEGQLQNNLGIDYNDADDEHQHVITLLSSSALPSVVRRYYEELGYLFE